MAADRCRMSVIQEVVPVTKPSITSVAEKFVSSELGFGNFQAMETIGNLLVSVAGTTSYMFTTDDYCVTTNTQPRTDLLAAGYSSQSYALGVNDTNIVVGGYSLTAIGDANAENWTASSLNSIWGGNFFIRGIAWNGSVWCVVADGAKIATSPDGINWTDRTGSLNAAGWGVLGINDIVWNGSVFCIVGDGTSVGTSADGITWTVVSVATFNCVCWTGTAFVAGGNFGVIRNSADGVSWTNQTDLFSTAWGSRGVYEIGSWGGRTIVVGEHTSGRSYISYSDDDGVNWTTQRLLDLGGSNIDQVNGLALSYDGSVLSLGGEVSVYAAIT